MPRPRSTLEHFTVEKWNSQAAGALLCILVWYGQPREVQLTRGAGMAPLNNVRNFDPKPVVHFIDSLGTRKLCGQYRSGGQYHGDRTVSDAPAE